MEGAGVAQAAHLNRSLPVVVVRGISDRADGTKEDTDRERWQQRAVANAAAFAVSLAEELSAEAQDDDRRTTETRRPTMPETIRNVAKGNARVGVQAGTVYGGIRITPEPVPPTDLAEALAGFRTRLQRARAGGHLDDDTYTAAEAELTVADKALESDTPQSRGTLTLALKKLRGLIGDVAELAAELAIIIGLAQGLS